MKEPPDQDFYKTIKVPLKHIIKNYETLKENYKLLGENYELLNKNYKF